MGELLLKIKRSKQGQVPQVQASYGSRTEYSILPRAGSIDSAIARLQTDLLRDPETRRGGPGNEVAGTSVDTNDLTNDPDDVAQPLLFNAVSGLGGALFGLLFNGKVEQLYRDAVLDCDRQGDSLQITLSVSSEADENPLPEDPWINLTPWECLWDPKNREFLATAGSTFFSRAIGERVERRPRPAPLRVLIMAAAPQIFRGRGLPQLKDYVEIEKIKAAAKGDDCIVDVVRGDSFEDLQLMLSNNSSASKRFDVFHFIGHGDFDSTRGEGYFLFREPDGAGAVPITASDLTELLTDPWAPLLVVLNSCRSAQGYGVDIFSSSAATLSLGRVPAVVAMQFPISDRAAIVFSKSLYSFLAQGATVQSAVRGARRTLKKQTPEWVTPVLYLRDPDYRLVEPKDLP